MASDIIERWKASAYHQLYLALLPFTHARSESNNADNLNSNFLQLGRRSGGRPQRAVHPMRLPVNTVIHTTLVGLKPATFRSLVGCWSSSATDSPTRSLTPLSSCESSTHKAAGRYYHRYIPLAVQCVPDLQQLKG